MRKEDNFSLTAIEWDKVSYNAHEKTWLDHNIDETIMNINYYVFGK